MAIISVEAFTLLSSSKVILIQNYFNLKNYPVPAFYAELRIFFYLAVGAPDIADGGIVGQCLNPAFVHSLAVPDSDMVDKLGKICAVARGDGVVDVINIESELAAAKPKTSSKPKKGTKSVSGSSASPAPANPPSLENERKLHLDHSLGGHTAAVSCV